MRPGHATWQLVLRKLYAPAEVGKLGLLWATKQNICSFYIAMNNPYSIAVEVGNRIHDLAHIERRLIWRQASEALCLRQFSQIAKTCKLQGHV